MKYNQHRLGKVVHNHVHTSHATKTHFRCAAIAQLEYRSFVLLLNLLVYFNEKISNKSSREIRDDLHLTATT